MSIQIALTTGAQTSTPAAPVGGTSVFGVEGTFQGTVQLIATFPGAAQPVLVLQTTKAGVFGVLTPDVAIEYSIRGALSSGQANAYFGA